MLSTDARVALTLRLLAGLTTREIARAYLVSEATVAQRIVRAKRTLSEARVPFEVPERDELAERLASVLEAIYLIFNEGYAATAGDDWIRPELIEEALRLGRILAELLPSEPEVHGLVALMELHASRSRARIGPSGEAVLLLDQDRSRWDWLLVGRGLAALDRAQSTGGALGPYTLQAAIAACHARARVAADTDWERIVALYDGLAQLLPSPVVELNRAVAVGMAFGPEAGLELVDALVSEPALQRLPPAPDRARRPAREARPLRRGAGGVRPRRIAHPKRPRARSAARPERGLLGPQRRLNRRRCSDVARQQDRCHLWRRRLDRRGRGPGLWPRGGEGVPRGPTDDGRGGRGRDPRSRRGGRNRQGRRTRPNQSPR